MIDKLAAKFQKLNVSKMTIVGVLGIVLMYVGVAGIVSASSPWWLGRGDAPRHIDYVWRVYKGDIPKFKDGFKYEPFAELGRGVYMDQPASAHPPLFYVIHAPIVGPILDSGEWQKGVAVGRSLNIFIGVLCVLALAWAGWEFGGKRKHIFAVSVPALSVMMHSFTTLNLNYALDVLLVLITTLTFILLRKIIINGLNRKYFLMLCTLSALGMSTKATYIAILITAITTLIIGGYLNGNRSTEIKKAVAAATLVVVITALAIGWFYYTNNYQETGRWFSSIPDNWEQIANRPQKSFWDVIFGNKLWSLLYSDYSSKITVSIALTSFSVAGFLVYLDRNKITTMLKDNKQRLIIFMLFLSVVGVFGTQIIHAIGQGNFYFRYMLPAILPIALFLSLGLLEYEKMRGSMVWLFSVSLGLFTLVGAVKAGGIETIPGIKDIATSIKAISPALEANGIPRELLFVFLFSFLIGSLWLGLSLSRLTKSKG